MPVRAPRATKVKRRLTIAAALVCTLAASFFIWNRSGSIYPKLPFGWARVLTERIPIAVEVDGRRLETVYSFAEPGRFHGPSSDRLALWLKDPNSVLGYDVLIIDRDREEVLVPCSGVRNYRLLRNRWLVQSDSGAEGVAFGNPKLDGRDPDFQQSEDTISFTIPPVLDLPSGRWNLKVNANG